MNDPAPDLAVAVGDPADAAPLARAVLPGAGVPRSPVWLARDGGPGGRVVGYLEARPVRDELHVLALAVEPERRRRGVASALLARVLAWAARQGVIAVHLEVRRSNRAARRFYAGFGFREVGKRSRYYGDGEDAVLLTRREPMALRRESLALGAR